MTVDVLPELPDFCWPVDTSCVDDWDEYEIDPDPEADPPVAGVRKYSDADRAYAVALAQQSMRMLTAYRVGGCPVVCRPCVPGCQESTWRTYPIDWDGGSTRWQPVQLGGTWLNIGCGHRGSCGCTSLQEVALPSGAGLVVEVKLDGSVMDPTAYRLDPGGLLVRQDGEGWPMCQNLSAPDSEPGTWSVSYLPGQPVDGLGARAAGILAGQFVRACSGGSCDLPQSVVTQVNRQGVTKQLTPGVFPGGKTGLRQVDSYIERWNPDGWRGPPSSVWSPDVEEPRLVGPDPLYAPVPYLPPIPMDGGNPESDFLVNTFDGGTP